nr:C39 family peptidase [Bacillus sp. B15-48]
MLRTIINRIGASASTNELLLNKITDQTFVVTGITEKNAEVSVIKNGKKLATVVTNDGGSFTFRMPLQPANTKLQFYVKNETGKTVVTKEVTVAKRERTKEALLTAPLVQQLPELPRGCEVTSLAMLLQYAGVEADKMTLAREVKRDPAKMQVIDGEIHFGNPYYGFVGDMYSFENPGLGVFVTPIEELGNNYMPGRMVNLTGTSFDSVLNYVAAGRPVWVIITSTFDVVPQAEWQTWQTEQGPIQVTRRQHSVLVTGYDSHYIYFNDPLDTEVNKKVPKENFIKGWEQYGQQALSYF